MRSLHEAVVKGHVHSGGIEDEASQLLVRRLSVEWKGEDLAC